MRRRFHKAIASVVCSAAMALAGTQAASASVLELALAIDGSGSIGSTDYASQLTAYHDLFTSGTFYDDYVAPSPFDTLAVRVFTFGTDVDAIGSGWTGIHSNADATAFGNTFTVGNMPYDGGWTNTEGVILDATASILSNDYAGSKLVIDISTDGVPTICDGGTSSSSTNCGVGETPVSAAIAAANAARTDGIIINAIGIGSGISDSFLNALVGINPADDPMGFYVRTPDFDEFQGALAGKLGREITGVPEPAPLLMLAAGLLLLVAVRRRSEIRI